MSKDRRNERVITTEFQAICDRRALQQSIPFTIDNYNSVYDDVVHVESIEARLRRQATALAAAAGLIDVDMGEIAEFEPVIEEGATVILLYTYSSPINGPDDRVCLSVHRLECFTF